MQRALPMVCILAGCNTGFAGNTPTGPRVVDTGPVADDTPEVCEEDADEDGLCDAKDKCPLDPANDADGDGLCADKDICPDTAGESCDVKVILAVQVDAFPDEASWQVLDHRSSTIARGDFRAPGDADYLPIEVSSDKATCVTMSDDEGDGGVRGMVFNRRLGKRYASWTWDDYDNRRSFCFTLDDGVNFDAPLEDDWAAEGACEVTFLVQLGAYPDEVGWELLSPTGRVVAFAEIGAYGSSDTNDRRDLALTSQTYTVRMYDAVGDGWVDDDASWSLGVKGASKPAGEGSLSAGKSQGDASVRISCR